MTRALDPSIAFIGIDIRGYGRSMKMDIPFTLKDMTDDVIGVMRDLGVTPNTIIWWDLNKTNVKKIGGSFSPLKIDAEIVADTRDFEVFDRAYHDKNRKHMIGVKHAIVRGKLGVRPNSFDIYDTRTDFGKSNMYVELVSIGFDNKIKLVVPPQRSKLNLADVSPLIDIPMAGQAELDVAVVHREIVAVVELVIEARHERLVVGTARVAAVTLARLQRQDRQEAAQAHAAQHVGKRIDAHVEDA